MTVHKGTATAVVCQSSASIPTFPAMLDQSEWTVSSLCACLEFLFFFIHFNETWKMPELVLQ